MKQLSKKIKRRIAVYLVFLVVGLLLLSGMPLVTKPVKADYVTDYIGVKVGYAGRELSDYVEVGDYHISEIESAFNIYQFAYSFFQPNKIEPAKYTYIVDSARGILVRDLLDYANIYYGDVYNLNFYVQDHNGMWCAFDRDSLFAGNRYYFNNLPGHRKIKYKTYPKTLSGTPEMESFLAAGGMPFTNVAASGKLLTELNEEGDGEEASKEPESQEPESQEPESQEPEPQEPESQEPESQEPESQEPESQEPESQEPESQEPESQEPESQEPESQEPEPQEPESQEPESQEPESQEPESQESESQEDEETDYSVIVGYDFDECWTDCEAVPPLLAIEDNWASFSEEFESAGADFTTLNTSSRFRLLYGQTSPTDSNTRDSAKYVRYVYVTLTGSPKFKEPEEKQELNHKVGATDTLEFDVENIYNEDMVETLSEYMTIFSTDESVIRISGVNIKKTEYSDRAKVEVTYQVVGEGDAEIGGTFNTYHGNPDEEGVVRLTRPVGGGDNAGGGEEQGANQPGRNDPQEEDQKGSPGGQNDSEDPTGAENSQPESSPQDEKNDPQKDSRPESDPQEEKSDPQKGSRQENGPQDEKNDPQKDSSHPAGETGEPQTRGKIEGEEDKTTLDKKPEQENSAALEEQTPAPVVDKVAEANVEAAEIKQGKTTVYQLSKEMQEKLNALKDTQIEAAPLSVTPVTEKVEELKLDDSSEKTAERQRLILLWTGAGCVAVCMLGGVTEYIGFRFRLKRTLRSRKEI